jgi:hypothetical protein
VINKDGAHNEAPDDILFSGICGFKSMRLTEAKIFAGCPYGNSSNGTGVVYAYKSFRTLMPTLEAGGQPSDKICPTQGNFVEEA